MSKTGMSGFDGKEDLDLVAGKVTGVRSWDIGTSAETLIGAYGGHWHPGENMAKCATGLSHDVPAEKCGCGFWAYWADSPYSHMTLIGVIDGYGPTHIGPRGFRSEKAKIRALARPVSTTGLEDISNRVSEVFGVPFYQSVEEMLEKHPLTTEYYDPAWEPVLDYSGGGWITVSLGSQTLFTSSVITTTGGWYSIGGGGVNTSVSSDLNTTWAVGAGGGGGGSGGAGGGISYGGSGGSSSISVSWEE